MLEDKEHVLMVLLQYRSFFVLLQCRVCDVLWLCLKPWPQHHCYTSASWSSQFVFKTWWAHCVASGVHRTCHSTKLSSKCLQCCHWCKAASSKVLSLLLCIFIVFLKWTLTFEYNISKVHFFRLSYILNIFIYVLYFKYI